MTFRATVLLLFFAGLMAFIGLNWTEFSTPSMLSFGFVVMEVPIGFVMFGALVLIVAMFAGYLLFVQASWAMQQRRTFQELEAQRKLADQAEASRTAELMTRINALGEQLAHAQQTATGELGSAISAHLGEIEDKLDQVIDPQRKG